MEDSNKKRNVSTSRLVCRVQARQQRVLCSEVPRCRLHRWLRLKVHPGDGGGQGSHFRWWPRIQQMNGSGLENTGISFISSRLVIVGIGWVSCLKAPEQL